jgi:hypothetical protein
MGCAIHVILMNYAERNTNIAGRDSEEDVAGEMERQNLFP